jgi:hypothetical protein
VERLIEACEKTCRTDYVLHFGFDDDDPIVKDAAAWASPRNQVSVGPRKGLGAWTNHLAAYWLGAKPRPLALASLGDDHVPETDGWDEILMSGLPERGGFTYPNDLRRTDIPEAVVISTPIVAALGWMCLPALRHWHLDVVWADLGWATDSIRFCPEVIVRHAHPLVDKTVPHDATYGDAAADWDADLAAYQKWRLYGMRQDIATVAKVTG